MALAEVEWDTRRGSDETPNGLMAVPGTGVEAHPTGRARDSAVRRLGARSPSLRLSCSRDDRASPERVVVVGVRW